MLRNIWIWLTNKWEEKKGILIELLKAKVRAELRPKIVEFIKVNADPEKCADLIVAELDKLIDRI